MGNISVTDVKEWLRSYREYELEMDIQQERLVRLITKIEGVGAQVITDMPTAHNGASDRITDLIAKKIEIEESVGRTVEYQRNERARIEKAVSQIDNAMGRAVIRHRYIDGVGWERVNSIVFGKMEDYEERQDSYLRRLFLIHGDALKELSEIISDNAEYADIKDIGK